MIQKGDYVTSNGVIDMLDFKGRSHIREFDLARVTKVEGDQISVMPGRFDNGRWRARRWAYTVHANDITLVEP